MELNAIVAVGMLQDNRGWPIGKDGKMPWHCPEDLKWFKDVTMGYPVIMGRKTYESIKKPLVGRLNIVISTTMNINRETCVYDNLVFAHSVEDAIEIAEKKSDKAFVIGGGSIYKYCIDNNLLDKIYIDELNEKVDDADTFFPIFTMLQGWDMVGRGVEIKPGYACATVWEYNGGYNNDVDKQYLDLINEIMCLGEEKDTRAGKTRSLFGKQLRFNLKNGLPMLTTKKMFSKGVIHELLWFLNGDTNIKYLVENGVHIWDDDAYRYYLELNKYWRGPDGLEDVYDKETFLKMVKLGSFSEKILNQDKSRYYYGDLGPVYGAQWVKWGGVNQIKELINTLKNNPDDRRMIVSAWNVGEISNMALPPCHYCCQFYTKKMTEYERWMYFEKNMLKEDDEEGNYNLNTFKDIRYIDGSLLPYLDRMGVPSRKLSCMWNMRSNDVCCGLPFNIMSYALFTHMVAQCVNMDVDELIFNGGDVHIYENHVETFKNEQSKRNPYKYALPKLVLNPNIKNINEFKYEDIKIEGYKSYPTVKYELNVGL